MPGWIGVDLDGTLAHHHRGDNIETIGEPIPAMVKRVVTWIAEGFEVRIMTARVAQCGEYSKESRRRDGEDFADNQRRMIHEWCVEHIGQKLRVTAQKDFAMIELWDDRAVRVVVNTGERCCG